MSSVKPYFVRAVHEWCSDNGLTPYLSVRIDEYVQVPAQLMGEPQAVLNIAWDATNNLLLGDDSISFQARFNGVVHDLIFPMQNVLGIFAKENGQGMRFPPETEYAEETKEAASSVVLSSPKPKKKDAPTKKRPPLRVVK